jgi:hypothetical protein
MLAGSLVIVTRLIIMLTTPAELGDRLLASTMSPIFAVNSVLSIVAFALLALALFAIYEHEALAAGWFGVFGVAAALVGTIFMTGDWWYEAFAVPWLADVAPIVFESGAGGRLLIGGLVSFALFTIGWAMFGLASIRAGVFPRTISVAILAGGVLAGVPIAGGYLYGSVIFGAALIALGVWLLRPAANANEAALGVA